jgi:hypothetical protein
MSELEKFKQAILRGEYPEAMAIFHDHGDESYMETALSIITMYQEEIDCWEETGESLGDELIRVIKERDSLLKRKALKEYEEKEKCDAEVGRSGRGILADYDEFAKRKEEPSFILPDFLGKLPDNFLIHENSGQEEDEPITNGSKWGTDPSLKLHLQAVPTPPAIGSIWNCGEDGYYRFDGENCRKLSSGEILESKEK